MGFIMLSYYDIVKLSAAVNGGIFSWVSLRSAAGLSVMVLWMKDSMMLCLPHKKLLQCSGRCRRHVGIPVALTLACPFIAGSRA